MNEKRKRSSKFDALKDKILLMAKFGLTDRQMSEVLDIDVSTINIWKKNNPDFFDELKANKMSADEKVEQSLYLKARGYKCKDTQFASHEGKITDQREYVKFYPPDTTACIFWLKNRQPEKWRDKTEVSNNISGSLSVEIERRTITSREELTRKIVSTTTKTKTTESNAGYDIDEVF